MGGRYVGPELDTGVPRPDMAAAAVDATLKVALETLTDKSAGDNRSQALVESSAQDDHRRTDVLIPRTEAAGCGGEWESPTAEDVGRQARQLADSCFSLRDSPLVRALSAAIQEGETRAEGQEDLGLHRLFFTVEGLRKLHTAVLADMAYVQDASWHSLTRRLGTYVTDVHAHAGHT